MRWLRQSTAIEVALGPFLDETDGKTAETALTITSSEVLLKKNEGDWAAKNEATDLVHESNGWYRCLLNATDTNTLGSLIVGVLEAGALPIWHEFMVVNTTVWDAWFASGVQTANVTQIAGAAVSTSTAQLGVNVVNFGGVAGTFSAGRPEVNTTHAAGTAWNSGSIGASTLAADTITAAKVAADVGTEYATTILGTAVPGSFGAGTLGARIGRLPDVTAGASGGVFIAGTNAATTVTTSFTTTFTGNLTGSVASVTGNVGGNVSGSVGSVTGLTASNLDATVSSRLAPTTAGRTLDVTATGEAGIDWANIGGATSTVSLTNTTIGTATNVTTVNGLSTGAIDSILDRPLEGTITLRQAARVFLGVLAGKVSGAGTTTITFRDTGDTKDRVTATVDANGNRSSITLDLT